MATSHTWLLEHWTDVACITFQLNSAALKGLEREPSSLGWQRHYSCDGTIQVQDTWSPHKSSLQASRGHMRLGSACKFSLGLVSGFGKGKFERSKMRELIDFKTSFGLTWQPNRLDRGEKRGVSSLPPSCESPEEQLPWPLGCTRMALRSSSDQLQ